MNATTYPMRCNPPRMDRRGTLIRRAPPASAAPHGFSLLELVAVVLLMAIIASAATLSLRGYVVRHRLARGVERIGRFDLALRNEARRTRSTQIGTLRPDDGTLIVRPDAGPSRTFALPGQVELAGVRIGGVASTGSSRQLSVAADGASPSYAVELRAGSSSHWVFVSGGTGQIVDGLDPSEVTALLEIR